MGAGPYSIAFSPWPGAKGPAVHVYYTKETLTTLCYAITLCHTKATAPKSHSASLPRTVYLPRSLHYYGITPCLHLSTMSICPCPPICIGICIGIPYPGACICIGAIPPATPAPYTPRFGVDPPYAP